MPGHDVAGPGRIETAAAVTGIKDWLRWRINRVRCMTLAEVPHR